MSQSPSVTKENTIVAGELGDGPELTVETLRDSFAVEGKTPSAATIRRWMCHGRSKGSYSIRLAAAESPFGLVSTAQAVRAFKQAFALPRGELVTHLRQEVERELLEPDLPTDVIASLSEHGIVLGAEAIHQHNAGTTGPEGQTRPDPASSEVRAG